MDSPPSWLQVVVTATVVLILGFGVIHVGWRSDSSKLPKVSRGWPYGPRWFFRVWRAQVATLIFLCLLFMAELLIILPSHVPPRSVEEHVQIALVATLLAIGLTLMATVAMTGRPRRLVPPRLRDVDVRSLAPRPRGRRVMRGPRRDG